MAGTTVNRASASPLHRWERHHVEVVDAAAAHLVTRAVDLLREHLASGGCDPIATAIVLEAMGGEGVDDLASAHPHCHVPARP